MIRPATRDDVGVIVELWEALVVYHHDLDDALPVARPDGDQHYGYYLMQCLDSADAHVLVSVEEATRRVVGYAVGMVVDLVPDSFVPQMSGLLADVYVKPQYRRAGHGRALVAEMVAWFQEQGVSMWELHVAAQNPVGLAFWRAIGARELMIRMRLEL